MNACTDADLVALLHGALDRERAAALRAALRRDPELRARHAALAVADAALLEALEAPAPSAARRLPWRPLVAAAALAVVAVLFVTGRGSDAAFARNDFVGLRAAPRGGASHPLFSDVQLELRWTNRGDGESWKYLSVVPRGFGEAPEALAQAQYAVETHGKIVPLTVAATLTGPDGRKLQASLKPAAAVMVRDAEVLQVVTLRDFEVQSLDPRPYLGGAPGADGWIEDFRWAYQHMPRAAAQRWLPDLPGEWRIELRVECLPPPVAGAWPTFAEPLLVQTSVWLGGEVSAWGEEHDGLCCRLVVATGCADLEHTPFAVQLQNRSGRTRAYNIAGTTMAKIPQPFHFDLLVGDGAQWQRCRQRERVGVIITSDEGMVAHPDGTVRTLVASLGYWRFDGKPLGELPAGRQLQVEFHFEPSLWNNGDRELWMGKLRSGAVALPRAR